MPQARAIVPDNGGVRAGLNATGVTIPNRRIVKHSTLVDSIALAVDGLDVYFGVTLAAILNGYAGDVQILGRAIVEAGAAIPIGSKVMANATGQAIVATSAKHALGVANTAALILGDLVEVDIDRTYMI